MARTNFHGPKPVQAIEVLLYCIQGHCLPSFILFFVLSALFGVIQYGVHINGYTVVDDQVKMWIGRRSKTKPTFPNMYDNMVGIHGMGRIAQSVTCLATDASLTVDPGVASSIPARLHTFVEIDHEIISMVILLPSAESLKKDCCQLQVKVCAQSTG